MTQPIQFPPGFSVSAPAVPGAAQHSAPVPGGRDFRAVLLESLDQVNRLQREADEGVQRLLTGETDNLAEVLAATSKAGIAFDLLMEVRNKLTEAYQEIQQMRV